jgi:chromosome segregation ATPase
MLAILLLVAFARLLIGNRIDRLIGTLSWLTSKSAAGSGISLGAAAPTWTRVTDAEPSAASNSSEPLLRVGTPVPSDRHEGIAGPEAVSRSAGTKAEDPQTVAGASIPEHATSFSDAKAPALLDPQLTEIVSAIDHLRSQQDAMKDAIEALANALHRTAQTHLEISEQFDSARTWAPHLQELIEKMITHTEAIGREARQDTSGLRDEMREKHEAQQRTITDLCTSLSRLEARVIPALRRVSSSHRAVTVMLERYSQPETREAASSSPEHSDQAETELAPMQDGGEEMGAQVEIVSELKRLMNELEEATPDRSSENGPEEP